VTLRADRLVAYVVADSGIEAAQLYTHAATVLPAHMRPVVVLLDAMPLTPNGKLDERALPEPDLASAVRSRPPRTPRERVLCDLFAEALGLPAVGIDDDFFQLGGHSPLVPGLAGRVTAALGVELSIRTLFSAPTVAALAAVLDSSVGPDDPLETLLPLRRTGSEPPLFCLPPGLGIGWMYSGLLRHVTDRPVYALQARALSAGGGRTPETMDAIVEDYLALIRSVQPDGPYHLLGWSFGGLVAHAIAERVPVASLTMLDTYPAAGQYHVAAEIDEETFRAELRDVAGDDGPLAALDERQTDALYEVVRSHARIGASYPPGVVAGDLLLFRAGAAREAAVGDPTIWKSHVDGDVDVVDVDCLHHEMTRPGPIDEIGRVVADRLAAGDR
jgi:thioesterase domain-containing protein